MWVQGILGVFLREPLADWQREARLLRASFRARGGEPPPDEDTHIALKVPCATVPFDGSFSMLGRRRTAQMEGPQTKAGQSMDTCSPSVVR